MNKSFLKSITSKKAACLGLLFFSLCVINGCVPILVGTGVVAGYTLSNDSAMGEVKCDYRTLWDVTTDKLQNLKAEIITSNESKGIIKAKVVDNDVTIKIDTISPSLQKLKISARKYLLPKPQFAQKIFVKIVQDLSD
ncbi:MAG: DUF3568 family protein [Candidatus Omnitrophica bacterium]|nr:DUF3568 family protein [Candidatus Omnitrophota bacterium]